jgi:hypothetical protein
MGEGEAHSILKCIQRFVTKILVAWLLGVGRRMYGSKESSNEVPC